MLRPAGLSASCTARVKSTFFDWGQFKDSMPDIAAMLCPPTRWPRGWAASR